MIALDFFDLQVLRMLMPYDQISWEEFYEFFPAIKSDREFCKELGKILRKLIESGSIESSTASQTPRFWRITATGRVTVFSFYQTSQISLNFL